MLFSKSWLIQLKRRLNAATKSRRSHLRKSAASHIDLLEPRQLLSAVPIGNEFQANTYTLGNQNFSAVAMDADGDFVVTWESYGQDGSDFGVYAQRYDAAGAAVGDEFQVNTYTSGRQSSPAVAIDANGDFVVTWHSNGQDGSGYGVYVQRYDATGVAVGVEFRVNTYTSGSQYTPAVAMDADGDFVVTWMDGGQDGSDSGIYAQRYAAGVAVGEEFRVNTYTASSQYYPVIAMDAGGDFAVAWQSEGQDGRMGVMGMILMRLIRTHISVLIPSPTARESIGCISGIARTTSQ